MLTPAEPAAAPIPTPRQQQMQKGREMTRTQQKNTAKQAMTIPAIIAEERPETEWEEKRKVIIWSIYTKTCLHILSK